MSIKCMYFYENMNMFLEFSKLLESDTWQIEKEYLGDRAVFYGKTKFFIKLKERFLSEKISIWPLKSEEVITWIDTMSLLRRLVVMLFKNGIKIDKVSIVMEYPLIFGNHMRSDYLLIYEKTIIVLEFGMFNQDEKRSEERYTKKLQESISYRQILSNLLHNSLNVVNYVMIYRPEYSRTYRTKMHENITYNDEELSKLCKFVTHLIEKENKTKPLYQLEYLNSIK